MGSISGCVQVGYDASGIDYRRQLESEGVDTSQLLTSKEAATGMAFISVDDNGGNQIIISAGANSDITPEEVAGSFSNVTYVVLLAFLCILLHGRSTQRSVILPSLN